MIDKNIFNYIHKDKEYNKFPTTSVGSGGSGGVNDWTYTNTTSGSYSISTVNIDTSGIKMAAGADIKIGNRSMREFMDSVEQRLAILEPNRKLEAEWAELKELGERYRAMEQDLIEKAKVWGILKD